MPPLMTVAVSSSKRERNMLSRKKALKFFKEWALPRRVEDYETEEKVYRETGVKKKIYRRVTPEEQDRGEQYPLFHNGMETFAHFGIGMGIYFAQLFSLIIITFICGCIMIAAMYEYTKSDFGDHNSHIVIPFTATCSSEYVTATEGCPRGEAECQALYRDNCELPYNAILADLFMSIALIVLVLMSQYFEKRMEKQLDYSIQTMQDYSVQVLDPQPDADNPDEWFEYFSQFGKVRGITITRRNNELHDLVLLKHNYTCKLQESLRNQYNLPTATGGDGVNDTAAVDIHILKAHIEQKYSSISEQLDRSVEKSYPVCRVYATFEYESDAAYCLASLELPDFQTMSDIQPDTIPPSFFFRQENVLNVTEPPEPDNILWENLPIPGGEKYTKRFIAFLIFVSVLVVCWYIIREVSEYSTTLVGIIIGIIDSCLPTLFDFLANYGTPTSHSNLQRTIQIQLFLTRFFISVVIPFLQISSWDKFLTKAFIRQILVTQITTCYLAPILAYLDLYGLFQRHILSYYFASDTQNEMNFQWMGTSYSLAEKYTNLSKVLCISFFYCLLTPMSLFLATIAFILTFAVDNFLLLRRWKSQSMLDANIAVRLRQQAIFAIAAHMYISMLFIYSWPMDQVMWASTTKEDGHFVYVNKEPEYAFWKNSIEPWHSASQEAIFNYYRITLSVVGFIALYIVILLPALQVLFRFFCFVQYSEFSPSKYNRHMKASSTATKPTHNDQVGGSKIMKYGDISGDEKSDLEDTPAADHILETNRSDDNSAANDDSDVDISDTLRLTKFSDLTNTPLYFPLIIDKKYSQKYLCSYTKHLLPQHHPKTITSAFQFQNQNQQESGSIHANHYDKDDLSCYIPIQRQAAVLSIVSYFDDNHPLQRKQDYLRELATGDGQHQTRSLTKIERKRLFQIVQSTRKVPKGMIQSNHKNNKQMAFSSSVMKEGKLFVSPQQMEILLSRTKSMMEVSNHNNLEDPESGNGSGPDSLRLMNLLKWKELGLPDPSHPPVLLESIPLPHPSITRGTSATIPPRPRPRSTVVPYEEPVVQGSEEEAAEVSILLELGQSPFPTLSSSSSTGPPHHPNHPSPPTTRTMAGYWCTMYNHIAKPVSSYLLNWENHVHDVWYSYLHDDGVLAQVYEKIDNARFPGGGQSHKSSNGTGNGNGNNNGNGRSGGGPGGRGELDARIALKESRKPAESAAPPSLAGLPGGNEAGAVVGSARATPRIHPLDNTSLSTTSPTTSPTTLPTAQDTGNTLTNNTNTNTSSAPPTSSTPAVEEANHPALQLTTEEVPSSNSNPPSALTTPSGSRHKHLLPLLPLPLDTPSDTSLPVQPQP